MLACFSFLLCIFFFFFLQGIVGSIDSIDRSIDRSVACFIMIRSTSVVSVFRVRVLATTPRQCSATYLLVQQQTAASERTGLTCLQLGLGVCGGINNNILSQLTAW